MQISGTVVFSYKSTSVDTTRFLNTDCLSSIYIIVVLLMFSEVNGVRGSFKIVDIKYTPDLADPQSTNYKMLSSKLQEKVS